MSEHPLLFTTEMVRAIFADRKTQTRRVPVDRYRKWKAGDLIWVREIFNDWDSPYYRNPRYKATDANYKLAKWKPSIHMPKKYARIWLEITGLREEWLQEMSYFDWVADFVPTYQEQEKALQSFVGEDNQKKMAAKFWDSINAKRGYAWDENPQVKVIEFKRITK